MKVQYLEEINVLTSYEVIRQYGTHLTQASRAYFLFACTSDKISTIFKKVCLSMNFFQPKLSNGGLGNRQQSVNL